MTSALPYAEVIGDPIEHSKSPLIHNHWLAKLAIDAEYRRTRVSSADFEAYVDARRGDPAWLGCNVTLPHKEVAARAADGADDDVRTVGAANLLRRTASGQLTAGNTDIEAIASVLDPLAPTSFGNRVCLIGAGGAARAALAYLERRGTTEVAIIVRDPAKGMEVRSGYALKGDTCGFEQAGLALQDAEWVINATPLGMSGAPPMPTSVIEGLHRTEDHAAVFDMIYAPPVTPLLNRASTLNRTAINGLPMLVHQAAASFALLFGAEAPRDPASDAELLARLGS